MSLDTIFPSDPYSALNDSLCKSQDIFYFNFNQEAKSSGSLSEWMAYEGGIAFYAVTCVLFSLLVLALFNLLRCIFPWQFLTKRFNDDHTKSSLKKSSWIFIDEKAVGEDGATYLWFQFRLIIVYSCILVISIVLIILHLFGENQGPDKHISSTSLKNIGLNVIHIVCYVFICVVLICMMFIHVRKRKIQSLGSPSRVCNRRWLMISGLPETTTKESLFNYLKGKFDTKGICLDGIRFLYDFTKLGPVKSELTFLWKINQQLIPKPEEIQKSWLDLLICSKFPKASSTSTPDASSFYSGEIDKLSDQKRAMLESLKFIGTAFVLFDSVEEAETALRLFQQSEKCKILDDEDKKFLPSRWTVQYAPPRSEINWERLKKPRSTWKKVLIWLGLTILYFLYIVVMDAPGYLLERFQLVGEGSNPISFMWKIYILPTLGKFCTHKLTDLVTNIDRYRQHLCLSSIHLGRLRSICNLSAILYLIRMTATKPLLQLFTGQFSIWDINLSCLFFPEHGNFITCAIIVNTASGILMDNIRLEFLMAYLSILATGLP